MLQNIINVLTSSRFKSFYWSTSIIAATGFLSLVAGSMDLFHLSPLATLIVGSILNQAVKGLNNLASGKPFGLVNTESKGLTA